MKILILLSVFCLMSLSLFAKEKPAENAGGEGGVPGQMEERGGAVRIYFESGVVTEWSGNNLTLRDGKKKSIAVNLAETPDKASARQMLGEEVAERDLGGSSKKKAPLAHKNPKFRNIQLPQGGDPLKSLGMQPTKVSEEKTPEGGTVTTTEYPDGSKNVVYVSKTLKEENSYDKKGTLVWRNLEGEEKGLKYKKTQWEEGSMIREYTRTQGTLSQVFDNQRNVYIFSFMNPNRELVREVTCQGGECE